MGRCRTDRAAEDLSVDWCQAGETFMLRTRITEQYGLKVPFTNAGMAFIATAPLVRAVCSAGGMGMLGGAAMPPDVMQAAIREIKAADPPCFGVDIIARFNGIEHIEVCVAEKVPVVVFFWDDPPDEWLSRLRTAGSHIWFQVGSVAEARAARRRGAQALIVQGSEAGGHNRAAATTFSLLPAVIDASTPSPLLLPAASPMVEPSLPRSRSVPRPFGWEPASSRASKPTRTRSTRVASSPRALRIPRAISSLVRSFRTPRPADCATASCGNGNVATIHRHTS
jgi:hypothetical protein